MNIEEEIKDGFFELKQKFRNEGPSSIYISHIVLHQKHPIFKKCDIETLKKFLQESSIVYLNKDQYLYRSGNNDNFVYFILFGRLIVQTTNHSKNNFAPDMQSISDNTTTNGMRNSGFVNIGWTLGEEVLFDRNLQLR